MCVVAAVNPGCGVPHFCPYPSPHPVGLDSIAYNPIVGYEIEQNQIASD